MNEVSAAITFAALAYICFLVFNIYNNTKDYFSSGLNSKVV